MHRWLLGLLIACESGSPAPQPSELSPEARLPEATTAWTPVSSNLPVDPIEGLGSPGSEVIRLLDRLALASLQLPDHSIESAGTFRQELRGPWIKSRERPSWRVRLPAKFKPDVSAATPRNLVLIKDGQPLDYLAKTSTPKEDRACWQVKEGWLTIHGLGNPRDWPTPPVLERTAQSVAMDRLNLVSSGLAPSDFAKASITVGPWTREALLLPAPASAEFEVDIPEDGFLRMGLGFATIPGVEGNAHSSIELDVDGQTIWTQELQSATEWTDVEVPLAQWAGSRVRLTFRSNPLGDPRGDWLALAEPEIIAPPVDTGPRRIVVLGIDTLRPDHLGAHGYDRATSPFLDRLAEQSLVFDSAWAPAPRTRPSFRTVLTGRWPLAARHAPTLGSLMQQAGFSTAGIVANVHLSPDMGFAEGYGSWRYAHSGDAADQVGRALDWLDTHQHEDSFLFVHFMDPHIFYLAPDPWTDHFVDARPDGIPDRYNRKTVDQLRARGLLDDAAQAFIEARYDGEIAYLDSELERLVTALDALPGRTLVVLLSDHGEEFWDHDKFEHNHSLYQELTRTLFWIRPPAGSLSQGPYRFAADVSLADMAPTLLDLVELDPSKRPPLDGVSLSPLWSSEGAALESSLANRGLPMGHLMYDTERWGVVADRHKYILHRTDGTQELYDLRRDPTEQVDLAPATGDLSRWWTALSDATGFSVGTGWRIEIDQLNEPISLWFSQPLTAVEVIDPEAARSRRANQEWGDAPPIRSEDVAHLSLEDGGRILHIKPGQYAKGTLALLGSPGYARQLDSEGRPSGNRLLADQTWELPLARLVAKSGVLILAGETESLMPVVEAQDETRDALQSLGYLE